MNRPLFLWLSAAICSFSLCNPVGAAVFERDWKTPGDGLLTYDDVNQREWLDLTATSLTQFPWSGIGQIPSALAEIAPGGLFEGFTRANRGDVVAFAQSAGIDTTTSSFATNAAPMSDLLALLGAEIRPTGYALAGGILDGNGAHFYVFPHSGPVGNAGFLLSPEPFSNSNDFFRAASVIGLMLFRDIPEPSTAMAMIIALLTAASLLRPRRSFRVGRNRPLFAWLSAAICAFSICNSVGAAVFERDWKTPGDGLLTYDDVNRREWLDLTVSSLTQFPGGTHDNTLPHALAELASSGLFDGFTFASREDVIAFAQSAGIDTDTHDFAVNASVTIHLLEILGASVNPDFAIAGGFIDELEPLPSGRQLGAHFIAFPTSGPNGSAGLIVSSANDFFRSASVAGVMLFRDIPEPSTAMAMIIALLAAAHCVRRRRSFRVGENRPLLLRLSAAICAFSLCNPVGAAVFERDWKTPGDGLLTYDDVNQREWLDLTVSSLTQFSASFDTSGILLDPQTTSDDRFIGVIHPNGIFRI